jgi:hypothetical protein
MNLGLGMAVGRALDGPRDQSTVNRMVAGSNPARGGNEINNLAETARSSKTPRVGTVWANRLPLSPLLRSSSDPAG